MKAGPVSDMKQKHQEKNNQLHQKTSQKIMEIFTLLYKVLDVESEKIYPYNNALG